MTDTDTNKEGFKLDFSGFILSLNTSALIHLGEIPDPESKQRAVNLPAAKQTISILEVIVQKTKGNLSQEEQKLIEDVVYDLKMKVIKA